MVKTFGIREIKVAAIIDSLYIKLTFYLVIVHLNWLLALYADFEVFQVKSGYY